MSSRALLIVEGSGIEGKVFTALKTKFNIGMELVTYEGNVSMLYDDMEKHGFYADIVGLLKSRERDPKKLATLQGTYTDIFIVLDLDPHQYVYVRDGVSQERALRSSAQTVARKAYEMARRMNNSTDPCSGQLYLNYPSMESIRDLDSFCDKSYVERFVSLWDLVKAKPFCGKGYKALVGQRSVEKNPAKYSCNNFEAIICLNILKMFRIMADVSEYKSYQEFRKNTDQTGILLKQCKFINQELSLAVLNTSIFFLIDYKGRAFYTNLPFIKHG